MRIEQVVVPMLRAAAKRDWAMRAADRALKPWNPFSPRRYRDPYPLYEQVRAHGPVSYQWTIQGWNVVGYEECEATLRSSQVSADRSEMMDVITPYTKTDSETVELFTRTMLMTDPPDHGRLRSLVNRAFTPRAVAALEPSIEKITLDLLHEIGEDRTVDVQKSFCDRVPIYAISDMLGIPRAERERLKLISDEVVKFIDPISGFDPYDMEAAVRDFRSLLGDIIAEREAQPQDDMLSRLLEAEEGGDRLSRAELESMVALLLVAGHETTAGLLGNALLALQHHPDAKAQLSEEPEIVENAVEELIRYDSPVQGTDRVATEDFELSGQRIKAGQMIGVFLGAANRDPRRYERPEVLQLDRHQPRPLSFGHGIHHCLGAALARLEARVALPLFVKTFPDYRIDEDRLEWKRSITLRGPAQLPVSLR
ncbi:MAG: cytochrome P450 [Actinomycetota bacterium]